MKNLGLKPSSKILTFEKIYPKQDLIRNMKLKDPHQIVYKIERIRLANNEPLMLETTFLPIYIYPSLTSKNLESESLYSILSEVGITLFSAEESYEPIVLDKNIAELLNCVPRSAGFAVERIAGASWEKYMNSHNQ